MDDIISYILYYADINDLLNFSEIDDIFNKILRERYFWSLYFDKYDLTMPIENYTNVNDWINIFKKINDANVKTLSLINLLTTNKKLTIQEYRDTDFNIKEYLENISMVTILDRINYLKVIHQECHFRYMMQISYINTQYKIIFVILYNHKTDVSNATLEKCDLYNTIYPFIFNPLFRINF